MAESKKPISKTWPRVISSTPKYNVGDIICCNDKQFCLILAIQNIEENGKTHYRKYDLLDLKNGNTTWLNHLIEDSSSTEFVA